MTTEELRRLGQELGLDVVGAAPAAPYTDTERHIAELDRHRTGLDLRQIEYLVDECEKVGTRRVDRIGKLDLLVAQAAFGILGEHLRQNKHRV